MTTDDARISDWLTGLKRGDESAVQKVWEQYYDKLIRLAQRNLAGVSKRESDEEDVVQSAMHSFFQRAAAGEFPKLNDRDELWKLLMTLTLRKVGRLRQRFAAAKRNSDRIDGEKGDEALAALVIEDEPSPAIAAELNEALRVLLNDLPNDDLRRIAVMKLEGFHNSEIGEWLGVTGKTVQRKLRLIRAHWSDCLPNPRDTAEN